jgi:predicted  nucleic acid-binding Zn-ribbon protein
VFLLQRTEEDVRQEPAKNAESMFSWELRKKRFTNILPRAAVAHIVQIREIRDELSRAKATIAAKERELLLKTEELKVMSDEIVRLVKENQEYHKLLQQAPARVNEFCA